MRAYSTPHAGSLYRHGVGWAVYFCKGVWRCLVKDRLNIVPRFAFFYLSIYNPVGRGITSGNQKIMKALFVLMAFVIAMFSPTALLAEADQLKKVRLNAGTPIDIVFPYDVKGSNGNISAMVENNVFDASGRNLIIRKGSRVWLKSYVKDNRSCGRPGSVTITGGTVNAVDGTPIQLDMTNYSKSGQSLAGLVWTVGILFAPIGLLTLIAKGSNPTIKAGTRLPNVSVDRNYNISVEDAYIDDNFEGNRQQPIKANDDGFDF